MPPRAKWAALVGGLCVAALAAIAALLQGDFGDTHARVVLTSLGFSVLSATASAGDALRRRDPHGAAPVGTLTIAASAVAFAALVIALWSDDLFDAPDGVWRTLGVAGLLSLAGSHAAVVLNGRRAGDSPAIGALVAISIACATFDTLVGTIAILGVVDDVSEGFVRLVAALLVVMLLTTALPPILRRMGAAAQAPRPDAFGHRHERAPTRGELAEELLRAADRLEQAGDATAVQREAAALRALAARAGRD